MYSQSSPGRAPARIFALRDPWEKAIGGVADVLRLPRAHVELITFVDTVEDFVERLDALPSSKL